MGKYVNNRVFKDGSVVDYPGKVQVDIVCPLHSAHHRQYTYYDVSIVTSGADKGMAQWGELVGQHMQTRWGKIGLGACCGMPEIIPLKE